MAALWTLGQSSPANRPLNNLVSELVSIEIAEDAPEAIRRATFEAPKDGWIYISAVRKPGATGKIDLFLDGGASPILTLDAAPALPETMRRVPAGAHTLEVRAEGDASLQSLVVRAVPQIIFYSIDHVGQLRWKHDHAHLRDYRNLWDQGILPNFNILVSEPYTDTAAYADEIKEWRAMGREWLAKSSVSKNGEDLEKIDAYWVKPLADPLVDGLIIDEFSRHHMGLFPFWAREIEKLSKRPELKGKAFYGFCGFANAQKALEPLVKGLTAENFYFAPEMYAYSLPLVERMPEQMMAWRKAYPGIEKNFVPFLAPNNSIAGMTFHVRPDYNYKVLVEAQMALVANDPAFEGIAGVGIWAARYMDNDVLRWYARLVRHYLIEGKTKRLGRDPLILRHLQNPGFERGDSSWKIESAAPGSAEIRDSSILPYTKRSWSAVPEKEKVLYTRRDPNRPNRISQTLHELTPGRVYHISVYTQDLNHTDKAVPIEVGIQIDGAELLPEHSLEKTSVIPAKEKQAGANVQSEPVAFDMPDTGTRLKMAWHHSRRLFRATTPTAELTLSDWPSDQPPSEGVGQELIWDFIEVAPDASLEPALPTATH